ncbi:MAG: alpha/beta fold hydrolase [Acidimicrobiia bacterium]|nr:alpha/beta fold hydrolase [Acidimicrobiia bacterium]
MTNSRPVMHPFADSYRVNGDQADAFLMLHGWTGSPAHFRLAADFVNRRGYTAYVPRLAGHGTSLEHMQETTRKDWVKSALEALYELSEFDRVHLVGLSMGGIIGLLLAATNDVASITTINSPQRLHSRRAWLARLMRGSKRIDAGEPSAVPHGEAARYWVHYEGSPVGTVADLLDLMDAAEHALPRITAPAVIIQSHADETVHPQSAQIIHDGLSSAEKRIVWLERSRHVALLDAERDRIHQEILFQATWTAH